MLRSRIWMMRAKVSVTCPAFGEGIWSKTAKGREMVLCRGGQANSSIILNGIPAGEKPLVAEIHSQST